MIKRHSVNKISNTEKTRAKSMFYFCQGCENVKSWYVSIRYNRFDIIKLNIY